MYYLRNEIVDKSTRFKQVFQLLLSLIVSFPVCSVRVYNLVKNSIFRVPFQPCTPSQIKDKNNLGTFWPLIRFLLDFRVNRGLLFDFIFSLHFLIMQICL